MKAAHHIRVRYHKMRTHLVVRMGLAWMVTNVLLAILATLLFHETAIRRWFYEYMLLELPITALLVLYLYLEMERLVIRPLRYTNEHDALTGVINQGSFWQRFDEWTTRSLRTKEPGVLWILDIDFFKKINDTHGHPVGDQILRQVAARIRDHVRSSDIVGRVGGEEFAVLLCGAQIQEVLPKAEALRKEIAEAAFDPPISVTVSIGVSDWRSVQNERKLARMQENWVNVTDDCLYYAKTHGRNQVSYSLFDPLGQILDPSRYTASDSHEK